MPQTTNNLNQPIGLPVSDWTPPLFPGREPMHGRFCRLEALQPERHARELYEANSLDTEGRNWTYLSSGPFARFDDYLSWVTAASNMTDTVFYAIIDAATDRAVGVASYLRIDPANGVIEVGNLNFSPLLQRTPAATEAMFLMMEYVFSRGYRRYEWKCDALNAPSRRAAERLGFVFEGIFRQAVMYKGRSRDTAWHSIIDTEWPNLQAAFQTWLAPSNFDADGNQKISLSPLTASFT
jgi:RimJ/RimL family protein N-acetyltransferase